MNRLLRALWNRLLPPGGDVAVAREPRPRRAHWLGYRPDPRRFDDQQPQPHELGPGDICWCWDEPEMAWALRTCRYLSPGDIWLPYSAIADPRTEP